ncbi:MAG: hypothetical protein ACTSQ8_20790, partial [Candidatus Helarchaeota archaeon]
MGITSELYELIVKIVEDKVKDIGIAHNAFDNLTNSIDKLAEAQKRTEERVGELAEAQKRTDTHLVKLDMSIDKLAEAQKRTEERVGEL